MLNRIKKIVIFSSLFSLNLSVQAMQSLEEEHLSEISGQDGISMAMDTSVTINRLIWKDKDGLQPIGSTSLLANPSQGMLVFGDVSQPVKINGGITNLKIDTDGQNSGFLNISIQLPDDLNIETGDIYVAQPTVQNNQPIQTKIMQNMSISLAGLNLTIQLGNSSQQNLAKIYGTVNNGIRVSDVGVLDTNGEHLIGASEIAVRDTGGIDFTFNGASVNVTPEGLYVSPSTGKMIDVTMSDFKFGGNTNQAMGNMFMSGFVLGGNNLRITGH